MINKEGGIETMDFNKLKRDTGRCFDMDGLMFDSERYVQKSWDIAGERLGYGPLGHNISIHWEQTLQIVRNISWNITEMIFHLINFRWIQRCIL